MTSVLFEKPVEGTLLPFIRVAITAVVSLRLEFHTAMKHRKAQLCVCVCVCVFSDLLDGLDSNYCRNPGDGIRPWCYYDANGCLRDYCDVCLLGKFP